METVKLGQVAPCHVVALPYPGRGHINPMMNLCKLLASKKHDIIITFVVTEEWHGFIGSDPKPDNIRFATVPNVIPSELGRAKDFPGFLESVCTKLQEPFELLMDQLETPVSALVVDPYVVWAVGVGNKRNIPVASLWPMSASVFTVFYHFELLKENGHFPADVTVRGNEVIDYIPGISSTRMADLPTILYTDLQQVLNRALQAVSSTSKGQYLLSTSFYELEPHVFDTLRAKMSSPVYPIGPSIPYFELSKTALDNDLNYLHWLDSQPKSSVMYISLGSFLSVSNAQMDEIIAGVKNSGVRFLWVARADDASKLKDGVGDMGLVVPWCDQLRVLCHSSIGGFWSHCGWNSTQEAVYAGVPVLTCPIFWDQVPNGKKIVEDWKIGYRVNQKKLGGGDLVTGEEVAELVQRFMDLGSNEGNEMRKRAKQLQETCHGTIAKGGSSDSNLDAFIKDISKGYSP